MIIFLGTLKHCVHCVMQDFFLYVYMQTKIIFILNTKSVFICCRNYRDKIMHYIKQSLTVQNRIRPGCRHRVVKPETELSQCRDLPRGSRGIWCFMSLQHRIPCLEFITLICVIFSLKKILDINSTQQTFEAIFSCIYERKITLLKDTISIRSIGKLWLKIKALNQGVVLYIPASLLLCCK